MEQITNVINNIKDIEILQTTIRIILIIIVSKILVKILTSKSSGIRKLQQKINLSRGKENTKNESEFLAKIIKVIKMIFNKAIQSET